MNPARFTLSQFQLTVLKLLSFILSSVGQNQPYNWIIWSGLYGLSGVGQNQHIIGLYGDFTSSNCILPANRRNYKIFVSQGPCLCASSKSQIPICLKKEKGVIDTCNPRSSNSGDFLGRCWTDPVCMLSFSPAYPKEVGLAKFFNI